MIFGGLLLVTIGFTKEKKLSIQVNKILLNNYSNTTNFIVLTSCLKKMFKNIVQKYIFCKFLKNLKFALANNS